MSLRKIILLAVFLSPATIGFGQKNNRASIEPCGCTFSTDPEALKMAPAVLLQVIHSHIQ